MEQNNDKEIYTSVNKKEFDNLLRECAKLTNICNDKKVEM